MNGQTNYSNEQLSLRQIILTYLRKIMDLNLKFINPENNIDFIRSYERAVLGLSDVLVSFFDSDMEKAEKIYTKAKATIIKETCKAEEIINENKYCRRSILISRKLFRELNKLLNRNDYLKDEIYGEEKDEVVETEEEKQKE